MPLIIIGIIQEMRTSVVTKSDLIEIVRMRIWGDPKNNISGLTLSLVLLSASWYAWIRIQTAASAGEIVSAFVTCLLLGLLFIKYGLSAALVAHYTWRTSLLVIASSGIQESSLFVSTAGASFSGYTLMLVAGTVLLVQIILRLARRRTT